MALKATIFKADLQVADMERHYYGDHALTIARHPSETDERMMVRILAFALHANEALAFGKGLSADDEPDIWQKDLTGAIELWIEVGQPDERRILKACGRAAQVVVYSYSNNSNVWWNQVSSKLERARNLQVVNLPSELTMELARMAKRTMQLQITLQEGQVWIANGDESVHLDLEVLKSRASS